MEETWRKWLREQSQEDRDKMLSVALGRLMETEEIRFRDYDYDDPEKGNECLYWNSCGDDIRDD